MFNIMFKYDQMYTCQPLVGKPIAPKRPTLINACVGLFFLIVSFVYKVTCT